MVDIGNEETEKILADIERRIQEEYARAVQELKEKYDEYFRLFDVKDKMWARMVQNGTRTQAEWDQWRMGQMMVGTRWATLREELAEDLHNANVNAKGIVNGNLAEIYAANHNFTTYEIERAAGIDTSYTLYDKDAVARILRDNPELLPQPGQSMQDTFSAFDAYKAGQNVNLTDAQKAAFDKLIQDGKDIRWQEGKIQSITLQALLQGESLPNLTKRIANELGEINHKSTIRYARTAVTGAQNAGKQDAYHRAQEHGAKIKRVWRAVFDQRTRHEHRVLDGQVRGLDEPFEVDGYKIDFPGDPKLAREAPYLYWNCRCGTRPLIDGLEPRAYKTRVNAQGETYEEWKAGKPKSQSITHQEEMAERMRQRTIRDLYGGKGSGDKAGGADFKGSDGLTDEFRKGMADTLRKSQNEDAKRVYEHYQDQLRCVDPNLKRGAFFRASDNGVHMNLVNVAKGDSLHNPYETAFHEFGHQIDFLAGGKNAFEYLSQQEYNGKHLLDIIKSDFRTFKKSVGVTKAADVIPILNAENMSLKARGNISDILEKLTGVSYPLGAGHGASYHKQDGKTEREFFAEVLDSAVANPEAYEQMKRLFPNAVNRIWELLKGVM